MSLVIDLISQLYTVTLLDANTPVSLALAGLSLVKLSVQSINYLSLSVIDKLFARRKQLLD